MPRPWVLALVAAVFLLLVLLPSAVSEEEEVVVTYSALLEQVRDGDVSSVALHVDSGAIDVTRVDGSTLTVQGPPGGIPDSDVAVLDEHEVRRDYAGQSSTWLGSLLVMLVPVLLIVGALIWMSRRTQQQLGGMTAFG